MVESLFEFAAMGKSVVASKAMKSSSSTAKAMKKGTAMKKAAYKKLTEISLKKVGGKTMTLAEKLQYYKDQDLCLIHKRNCDIEAACNAIMIVLSCYISTTSLRYKLYTLMNTLQRSLQL